MGEKADPSNLVELVERLASIGLEEKDALLYLHLCVHGPSRASEAAAAAKLNRTETYWAMDSLIRRGFVTAGLERPTLYEAAPPEKVFDDALAQHGARRKSIERAREIALAQLATLRSGRTGEPLKASYKIVQGRPAIHAMADSMVRRARMGQSMVSTFFSPANATDANSVFMTTVARAAEGLPMRLLLCETPGMTDRLAELLTHPDVHVRYFDPPAPLRFTIVDDREILVWLATDKSPDLDAKDDVAMWTNATDFVGAHRVLYDLLWAKGRPAPRPKGPG